MSAGTVIYVSPNYGMIVVASDEGFSVVELLGSEGEIETGDVVNADWSELGGGDIRKDGEDFSVFFQGTWSSRESAIRNAYMTGGGS